MNIREIIAAERWEHEANRIQHNSSLDRILETIEYVNVLNQRQAERIEYLEARLEKLRQTVHVLETVTPVKGMCPCGAYNLTLFGHKNNYCRKCGAKLNWEVE